MGSLLVRKRKRINRSFYCPEAAFYYLPLCSDFCHGTVRYSGMDANRSLQHPWKWTQDAFLMMASGAQSTALNIPDAEGGPHGQRARKCRTWPGSEEMNMLSRKELGGEKQQPRGRFPNHSSSSCSNFLLHHRLESVPEDIPAAS